MFRSVDMSYLQVLLPNAVAEEFADRMARQDIMQFTDLNGELITQRKYTMDIIKIQEIERQIKTMEELLDLYSIFRDTDVRGSDLQSEKRTSNTSQVIETITHDIGDAYKKLGEQVSMEQELKKQLSQQDALVYVLGELDKFLKDRRQLVQERLGSEHKEQSVSEVGFKYFAGVVTIGQRVSFERQIFLTSRGNSFIQFEESEAEELESEKIPFVVFFLGDQLKRSLKRLCQFMNIQVCYESDVERSREELLQEANSKRNDFYRIHSATANQLERDMRDVSQQIKKWKVTLLQEKSIRITLNKFSINQGNNFLRAEGWCPTSSQAIVREILDDITKNKGVGRPIIQDTNPPRVPAAIVPTHFETNSFTASFQSIVDTYGVPRYKEFNPTVPTIVTFPFLFAVMYGDIFHGSFIFLFGFILCMGARFGQWDKSLNQNVKDAADARYIILFMGAFAIYCGVIYNDCMSLMLNGFNKSQWGYGFDSSQQTVLFQGKDTYAFGIDPVWHALDNQLTFENSLKMKLSVIIGVTQMTYGLFLKLSNHIQEQDMISVFFEFVPQFIFMMSFFGYMIFLIIYKWCIDWRTSTLPATPSLITVLIKMILGIGTISDETQILTDANLQKTIQEILVFLMAVSVPWMLLFKPLLLRSKHKREMAAREMHGIVDVESHGIIQQSSRGAQGSGYERFDADADADIDIDGDEKKERVQSPPDITEEEFDFSEIVIHQLIHTIEYVLGTISNTASYLRLWALSLAHAELSEVFYDQTIATTMAGEASATQIILNVVAQFVFLMATIGVLLVMDVLECFLHALRLHWVEFQNKFFYADGIPFKPCSYRLFLNED